MHLQRKALIVKVLQMAFLLGWEKMLWDVNCAEFELEAAAADDGDDAERAHLSRPLHRNSLPSLQQICHVPTSNPQETLILRLNRGFF